MEARPRVLFVNPAPNVFGAEASLLRLLAAGRLDAAVAAPPGGTLEEELRKFGVPFFALECAGVRAAKNPLPHLRFLRAFHRILRTFRPGVVVQNLDGNAPLVAAAARLCGVPLLRFCRFEFTPPAHRRERWAWRQAREIVCPSETVRGQVAAWAPPNLASHTHALYDSCECGEPDEAGAARFRRQFDLEDAEIVGYVGRLDPAKDIATAVRALAKLASARPKLRLVVAGEVANGPFPQERARLEKLAAALGVANRLVFTGYLPRERMPGAMTAFSVLVLPSLSESFGTVLAEAWSIGTPTVSTEAGACREITLASGGGLLFPPGDDFALALALDRLLSHPELCDSLGKSGRSWTLSHCEPGAYAARFVEILRAAEGRRA